MLFKRKPKIKINDKYQASIDYILHLRKQFLNQYLYYNIYNSPHYLTPLKLQCILYIAESLSLVKYDKGIFPDNTFIASRYGPAIRTVYYYMYSPNIISTIPEKDNLEFSVLSDEEKEMIELAYNTLIEKSVYDIVEILQLEGGPWHQVYKEFEDIPISQDSIKNYFGG